MWAETCKQSRGMFLSGWGRKMWAEEAGAWLLDRFDSLRVWTNQPQNAALFMDCINLGSHSSSRNYLKSTWLWMLLDWDFVSSCSSSLSEDVSSSFALPAAVPAKHPMRSWIPRRAFSASVWDWYLQVVCVWRKDLPCFDCFYCFG